MNMAVGEYHLAHKYSMERFTDADLTKIATCRGN